MRASVAIEEIFGNRSRTLVLRVLHGVDVPLNASQVSARTGLTHPAVSEALRHLRERGLVASSPAGRATVHWLVRENIYVRSIVEPVFAAEESIPQALLDDLCEEFSELALAIAVFGSYARGNQTIDSDVDVILVACSDQARAAIEERLAEYAVPFRRRWGASLSPIVYLAEEAAQLAEHAPALWSSVARDAVTVAGIPPAEWSQL
jgi:predicted nucleotidyltransferase